MSLTANKRWIKQLAQVWKTLTEDEQGRYRELAIFPEDVDIPLPAITKLQSITGGLDDLDTETLCTRLGGLLAFAAV